MFKKILIANRGEIAVRIIRTCREMDIETVAVYTENDRMSMHVRLADTAVCLESPDDLMNAERLIAIGLEHGVDAVHPGYGFLAEEASFIRGCEAAGMTWIGPSAEIVELLRTKTEALKKAREAGFLTVPHSNDSFGVGDLDQLQAAAAELGYPIIIKSCSGGRGRGERMVMSPDELAEAVRKSQVEGQAVYRNRRVYLEKAILPAYQVGVQIVADGHGNLIHMGEREGSLLQNGQKIVEEAPARCVNDEQRRDLWHTAVELGKLFNYENVGTVEFVVDDDGRCYFSEIKARIQVEHALTEMLTRVDTVRQQIQIAAGMPVSLTQDEVWLGGHAMLCRVSASDPWHHYRPSPGRLDRVRLPGGPEVRVDTYVYCGCDVPATYDPLLAKVTVWAKTREQCLTRMQRTLEDFVLLGPPTNIPLLQQVLHAPRFVDGSYGTQYRVPLRSNSASIPTEHLRNLAIATAVVHLRRNAMVAPAISERLRGGWHRSSRRLPQ